jgi:YD repeat-containing protein
MHVWDDDGNITKITHEDGSYWDYGYDGRDRLTSADRKSASGNIVAKYRYTYDDADNMQTKVEPYEDDFEDGATTGWSNWGSTWSAAGGVLVKTNHGEARPPIARPACFSTLGARVAWGFSPRSS